MPALQASLKGTGILVAMPACLFLQALPRGAGMVVAVVQGPDAGDLSADSITPICHHLSLDPR